jgi:hypothetical protein
MSKARNFDHCYTRLSIFLEFSELRDPGYAKILAFMESRVKLKALSGEYLDLLQAIRKVDQVVANFLQYGAKSIRVVGASPTLRTNECRCLSFFW